MGELVENIRRIGLFMIVAQTVIHFAAGKQYEKYMKIIAGVIVLLLFLNPFLKSSEEITGEWMAEMERLVRKVESESGDWNIGGQLAGKSIESMAINQIEEQIKSRLNDVISIEKYHVTDVMVDLGAESGPASGMENGIVRDRVLQRVCVTVQRTEHPEQWEETNKDKAGKVDEEKQPVVEKIHIEIEEIERGEKELPQEESVAENGETQQRELGRIFARTLGLDEDRVEVICHGEW